MHSFSITGLSAYPGIFNPDNGGSDIRYSLDSAGNASVLARIDSSYGTRFRTIDTGIQAPGSHSIAWNGCGDDGNIVPADTYTITISARAAGQGPINDDQAAQDGSTATAQTTVVADGSPPEINVFSPADGQSFPLGSRVKASWNADDEMTGMRNASATAEDGAYIDTATAGEKVFTVTATDNLGNTDDKTVTYFVNYNSSAQDRFETATVQISSAVRTAAYNVEIADTPEKLDQGLMNRTSLDTGAGMLFVFSGDADHYFWMENTLIPLDLIYISSGFRVVGVRENAVPDSTDPISPPGPSMYVLEVNAGQCREHDIRAGDRVTISA